MYFCSHIVPEYSFLDARGLGAYEGRSLDSVTEVADFLLVFYLFDILSTINFCMIKCKRGPWVTKKFEPDANKVH